MLEPAARRELRRRLDEPAHADAFNCVKCPRSGCPMWQRLELEDPVEGREVFEGCGFKLLPTYFHLAMGFSLGAMQTSEAMGKQVVNAIGEGVKQMQQLEAQRELKVLSGGKGE